MGGFSRHQPPLAVSRLRRLALPLALAIVPPLGAQGTVAGRVTILESGSARSRDLKNAVVWLESLDAPAARPAAGPAAGPAAPTRVAMEGREFRPAVRVATPGTVVRFPNDDPYRHNVFSDAGPKRFDLGLYGRGETRDAQLDRPGVYPIFCNVHARMVAYVVVVPSRWHGQAAADGGFRIDEVPAGRYRLRAWHDRGGEHARDLVVTAAATTADVQLDARGWRPVPHKNKFGKDYPPETRDRY